MIDKCRFDECDEMVERKRGGQIFCSRGCKSKYHNKVRRGERRAYVKRELLEIPIYFRIRGKIHYEGLSL